ncbi:MAG: TspO/MBR family protein [Gemmatimonadota bacterium]
MFVLAFGEAILAGADAAEVYANIRLPRLSPPFWLWITIGVLYYAVCGIVMARLFASDHKLRHLALGVTLALMSINAGWGVLFFRETQFALAFFVSVPYALGASGLYGLLRRIDPVAARIFAPYLAYLAFATLWTYAVYRANPLMS